MIDSPSLGTPRSQVQMRAVSEDEAGLRLDRWFQRHFPGLSHGALQKLLRTGQVRVDGKRAEGKDRVEPGQQVRLPPGVTMAPPAKPREIPTVSDRDAAWRRLSGIARRKSATGRLSWGCHRSPKGPSTCPCPSGPARETGR